MGLPCSWARISSMHLSLSPNIYVTLPVPCTYSLWVFLNLTISCIFCQVLDYRFVCFTSFPWFIPLALDDIYTVSIQMFFLAQWLSAFYLSCLWISSKVVVRLNSLGVVISATYVSGGQQYILVSWTISKKFPYLLFSIKICLILSLDIYQTLLGNQCHK